MNNFPKHCLKLIPLIGLFLFACEDSSLQFDASGAFEAEETIISAQTAGVLKTWNLEEGALVKKGNVIGIIDTLPLHLKKKQLEAQIEAVLSRKPDKKVQLASLREQLSTAKKDKKRIENLVEAKVAGQKQLDDINSSISVLQKQITAMKSSLDISSEGIEKESAPLEFQIAQIQDQIERSIIKAPIDGTILTNFVRQHEMAAPGMPLFKIANVSALILRAYVSNDQLPKIKLGQEVNVYADDGSGGFSENKGKLMWISEQAEFTPKTIQTKNERANLVYATKIKVPNQGQFKLGMYGEVKF